MRASATTRNATQNSLTMVWSLLVKRTKISIGQGQYLWPHALRKTLHVVEVTTASHTENPHYRVQTQADMKNLPSHCLDIQSHTLQTMYFPKPPRTPALTHAQCSPIFSDAEPWEEIISSQAGAIVSGQINRGIIWSDAARGLWRLYVLCFHLNFVREARCSSHYAERRLPPFAARVWWKGIKESYPTQKVCIFQVQVSRLISLLQ